MRIVFDITGELKSGLFQNRRIYIKKVENYNEEIIPHKTKNKKSIEDESNAPRLF